MTVRIPETNTETPMGATLVADGASFRVWAPKATAVHVVGEATGHEPSEKNKLIPLGDHWLGFIPGVKDRDLYMFWIEGEGSSGLKRDPYAKELETPFPGRCVVRKNDFPWHETKFVTPDFSDLILYQLHVGAFYSERGATSGGRFLEVIHKLPYLADLGINAVQLLPIQEFPTEFSLGYNGTDYFSPEMDYAVPDSEIEKHLPRINEYLKAKGQAPFKEEDLRGEMNQLKALVDLFHVWGIAVIFDVVYNHAGGSFGSESLWYFDRQVEESKWNSCFFSDKDWAGGAVFDFGDPQVRQFLIDNALTLLEDYRVDGFRFDEVSVIDHQSYDGAGWRFCQDLTDTVRSRFPRALLHAEYWPVNDWMVRPRSEGGAGFSTTMTDAPRRAIREVLASASWPGGHSLPMSALGHSLQGMPKKWQGINSFENHDLVRRPEGPDDHDRMPRLAKLADPSDARSWYARSRARVATGLLLCAPGTPMLFMGQEFLEDKPWSDYLRGHSELRLYWDGLEGDDPTMRDFLRFCRECIQLRWDYPALRGEGYQVIHAHDANHVLVFQRWIPGTGKTVVVATNLSNETRYDYQVGMPLSGHWHEVFNSDVYDNWVNQNCAGNYGGVDANGPGMHGMMQSACLCLPANGFVVLTQ